MNSVVRGLRSFIVGSCRNSCFIDKRTDRLLHTIAEPRTLRLNGHHPRIKYPKLESCRRVGVSLKNPKSEKGLGWIAMASRLSVDGAIRAISLNPYVLALGAWELLLCALPRVCQK
ncbi:unnamed protein product [Chondrus crispus]|uniref:Uncharacterized protein n=1 Tax=Chondrus crispus TaxID=2769 RepID=R7QFW0_CHOCR|nr:unnamed protein product [Chondrus crispus]CDF36954.1 unnamed protein product [Chondrus crispus]|eukprot:XP_005716773.1 unnamed protein product [Chondrus crispus]